MDVAYTSIVMDTSAAEAQLSRVDGQRSVVSAAIAAVIADFTKAYHITNTRRDEMTRRVMDVVALSEKELSRIDVKVEKVRSQVTGLTRAMMSHVYHMAAQVWNVVENMTGLGKTAAGRMIGLAISAISSVISMGYAASATMSTMGPLGWVMAGAQMTSTMTSVYAMANAVATQNAIQANTDTLGDISRGMDY